MGKGSVQLLSSPVTLNEASLRALVIASWFRVLLPTVSPGTISPACLSIIQPQSGSGVGTDRNVTEVARPYPSEAPSLAALLGLTSS